MKRLFAVMALVLFAGMGRGQVIIGPIAKPSEGRAGIDPTTGSWLSQRNGVWGHWGNYDGPDVSAAGPINRMPTGPSALESWIRKADRDWERMRRKSKSYQPPVKVEKDPHALRMDHEIEAGRKLKYAKQIMADANDASGAERRRLAKLGQDRLRELVENYKGTDAAAEAGELLGRIK